MMINQSKTLALLAGRSDENKIRPKIVKVSPQQIASSKRRRASSASIEHSSRFDIVVDEEPLKPYFILSVDLAFEITEGSGSKWHVAAPTEDKALEAFVHEMEDGIIPVLILSGDELRDHAKILDRELLDHMERPRRRRRKQ
jgi:hypothetical protein